VGGAYLLGLRRLAIVCHGSSSRRAIANAIALAGRGVEERVNERTGAALEAAGVTRGQGGAEPDSASVPADSVNAI
jgi:glycerol-3-phosphate acyltransferase PlsX